MPPLVKPFRALSKRLQRTLAYQQTQCTAVEEQLVTARHREHALIDICRMIDDIMSLHNRLHRSGQHSTLQRKQQKKNQHQHLQQHQQSQEPQQVQTQQEVGSGSHHQQPQSQRQQLQQPQTQTQMQRQQHQQRQQEVGIDSQQQPQQQALQPQQALHHQQQASPPGQQPSSSPQRQNNGSSSSGGELLSLLDAVPPYCCISHLLRSATPELARVATSMTAEQWKQLHTEVVHELLTLQQLAARQQPPQPPQPPQLPHVFQPAAQQQSSTTGVGAAVLQNTLLRCPSQGSSSTAKPATAAAAAAAAAAAGGAVLSGAASINEGRQAAATVRRVGKALYGLMAVSVALEPRPLFQALAGNQARQEQRLQRLQQHARGLEQQQQHQQQEQELDNHWMHVVSKMQLTKQQAGYFQACLAEIEPLLNGKHDNLRRLLPLSTSPCWLVLTAEKLRQQQDQHQQQQQLLQQRGAADVAAAGVAAIHLQAAATSSAPGSGTFSTQGAAAAGAAGSTGAGRAPAGGSSGSSSSSSSSLTALSGCLSQLPLYGLVLMNLLMDSLTPEQTATMLTASFPWGPRAFPIAMCAGRLLQQQGEGMGRQQQQQQQPGQQAPGFEQQLREVELHQAQKRQDWWTDLMQALPADLLS